MLINIDLDPGGFAHVLIGQLVENGRNNPAAAAPGRPKSDYHQPVGFEYGVFKFLVVDSQWCHRQNPP